MGVEALVRWQHPDRGLLFPDAFVPLAEHSGMVRPFTLLILDRALREFSELRRVAISTVDPALTRWVGDEFTLAVNFSARNLLDLDLPEHVRERLAHYGVPAHRLVIEITESANVHDWVSAERVMKALGDLGCLVSIDDFGTGFSSLQSLVQRKDTVSEIKIDRSFVGALVNGSGAEFALVQAIVSMAHGTRCRVVAEGVELAESVPVLQAMGCDIAQGYYIARPMPVSKLLPWFEAWPQAWVLMAPAEMTPPFVWSADQPRGYRAPTPTALTTAAR
jgi:EAL domain-containing protein (putative c-di-GMP-specific phosphodiesterase class I)